MDLERLYAYRFKDVDQQAREAVWGPIARFLYEALDRPTRVLDPAAGRCEFINAIPAAERWAVDRVDYQGPPSGVASADRGLPAPAALLETLRKTIPCDRGAVSAPVLVSRGSSSAPT